MKPNKIQMAIASEIRSQGSFWEHTNDITSPTHLCDIDECIDQLDDVGLTQTEIDELKFRLTKLYEFIRKFDKRT